jgi:drug/metabolite transporter (DMT)-like permease
LLAAALFGASTPFAKSLVGQVEPVMLAGMLYLGSGLGLSAFFFLRAFAQRAGSDETAGLVSRDLPWLRGAIASGGIAGPVLLMVGLSLTVRLLAELPLSI